MAPFGPIVHVIDDDDIALWMFRELLRDVDAEVRTFASARAFLDSFQPSPCECLICDLRMPEIDGLEVQQTLLDAGNHLPIILVSGNAEIPLAVEAMRKGAFDFLEKPVDGALLVSKVGKALERSRELHTRHLAHVARQARLALLTAKERHIAELVAAGKSSPRIAEELGLSVRTVENHRARLMEKLHVDSLADLVKLLI